MIQMAGSTLTFRDYAYVVAELDPVKTKWRAISQQLSLNESVLKRIESSYPTDKARLDMAVSQWFANGRPSWGALIEALQRPSVGEPYLAEIIRQKFTPAAHLTNLSMDGVILPSFTPTTTSNLVATSSHTIQTVDNSVATSTGLKRKQLHCTQTTFLQPAKRKRADDSLLPASFSDDNFVNVKPSEHKCTKCSRVPRKPLQSLCCGMLYCEPCSLKVDLCPTHSKKTEYKVDLSLKTKLSRLMMRCLKGCGEKFAMYQMKEHLVDCQGKSSNPDSVNSTITTTAEGSVGVAHSGPPTMVTGSLNNAHLTRDPLKHGTGAGMDQVATSTCDNTAVSPLLLPPLAEVIPLTNLLTMPLPQVQDTPTVQSTLTQSMSIMGSSNQKRSASKRKNTQSKKHLSNAPLTTPTSTTMPKSVMNTPTSLITTPIQAPPVTVNVPATTILLVPTPTVSSVATPTTTPLASGDIDASSLKLGKPFSLHPSAQSTTSIHPTILTSSTPPPPSASMAPPSLNATPTTGSSKVITTLPNNIPSLMKVLKDYLSRNVPGLSDSPSIVGNPVVLQKLLESLQKVKPSAETDTALIMKRKQAESSKEISTTSSFKTFPVVTSCKPSVCGTVVPVSTVSSVGTTASLSSVSLSKPAAAVTKDSLLRMGNHTRPRTPSGEGAASTKPNAPHSTHRVSETPITPPSALPGGGVASTTQTTIPSGRGVASSIPKTPLIQKSVASKTQPSAPSIGGVASATQKTPLGVASTAPTSTLSGGGVASTSVYVSNTLSGGGVASSIPSTQKGVAPSSTPSVVGVASTLLSEMGVVSAATPRTLSGGVVSTTASTHTTTLSGGGAICSVSKNVASETSSIQLTPPSEGDVDSTVPKTPSTQLPGMGMAYTTPSTQLSTLSVGGVASKTGGAVSKSPKSVAVEISKVKVSGGGVSSASSKTPKTLRGRPTRVKLSTKKATMSARKTATSNISKRAVLRTLFNGKGATVSPQQKTPATNIKRAAISTPTNPQLSMTNESVSMSNVTTVSIAKPNTAVIGSNETTFPVAESNGTTVSISESIMPVSMSNTTSISAAASNISVAKSNEITLNDSEFAVKPKIEVHCSKCGRVPLEPQRPKCSCNVLYCPSCAEAVTKCPLCEKSKGFDVDWNLRKRIGNLQVRCLYRREGCEWRGTFTSRAEHVVNCPKQRHPCKYKPLGCEEMVLVSEEGDHERTSKDRHLELALDKVLTLVEQMKALRGEVAELKKR